MKIDKPTLLLDKNRCRNNIRYMAGKLKQLGLMYRPHFKTHQSAEIANWYREMGVTAITVSSPGMASYFMENGWNDITIAFPVTPAQFPIIDQLAEHSDIKIFLNDPESAMYYAENATKRMDVFIEIDAGYHRTGVSCRDLEVIQNILAILKNSSTVHFYGFYVHDGRTYKVKGKESVENVIKPVLDELQQLKEIYHDCRICLGDTPSASLVERFPGVDEMSPGNNVFYDLMQVGIESCTLRDIAVTVACPVAQVKTAANEAVLHGGAVHFSKETMNWMGREIYGVPVSFTGGEFGELTPDSYLSGLSQEHGLLTVNDEQLSHLKPGDTVCIFPVHSCLTVNFFSHYLTLDGERIEKRILS